MAQSQRRLTRPRAIAKNGRSVRDMSWGLWKMAWIYLGIAGLLEIVWAYAMKLSEGFSRPLPTAITLVGMVASVWFLSLSMKVLPLGTAYVIWTGIGAVGAFVLGIAVLGESVDLLRLVAAVLIVSGLVLMKLGSPH